MSWRDHRILGLTRGEATWLVAGILLLTYETWAIATREGDVLTRAYRAGAPRWMFWPLGVGVLMGHLHGPAVPDLAGRGGIGFLLALALGVLYRDLFERTRYPVEWVAPLFVAGVLLGSLLWSGRP